MEDNYRASLTMEFEPFFCLCYYCYFEPWTNILAFFLILAAVGTVEGLYRNYRGRRVTVEPGETWFLVGKEVRRMD
ncbi:MAG: hypothetical protein IKA48_00595 [Fibrobacter sp.]|nr:hypothetical protein [Fibrobacter sp.]